MKISTLLDCLGAKTDKDVAIEYIALVELCSNALPASISTKPS